jgi:hypothetical protein
MLSTEPNRTEPREAKYPNKAVDSEYYLRIQLERIQHATGCFNDDYFSSSEEQLEKSSGTGVGSREAVLAATKKQLMR